MFTDLGSLIENFQWDISAVQILRGINFVSFQKVKTAILTIWATSNLVFSGIFDISSVKLFPKIKIQNLHDC